MSKPKKKRFWYHYNKPESKRQGRNVLTLHWRDKCHLIHSLECHAPTESHDRKAQPRCVIRGWSRGITIEYVSSSHSKHAIIH
jgi:hypothetical protein